MSRLAAAINQTLREGVGSERELRSRHFGIQSEQNRYDQFRSDRMASEQAAGDRWQRTHDAEQQRWEKGYQQDERENEASREDALFRRGMLEKDYNRQVGMDRYTRYQDKVESRYQRERDTADDQYRDIEQSTKADQFAATQLMEKQRMIMTREQNRISNTIAREAQQSIEAYRNDQSALNWSEAERRGTSNMLDREIKKTEMESDAMYRRRILDQGDRRLDIAEEANRIEAGEGSLNISTSGLNRTTDLTAEVSPFPQAMIDASKKKHAWWQFAGPLALTLPYKWHRGMNWADPDETGKQTQQDVLWEEGQRAYKRHFNQTGSYEASIAHTEAEWDGFLKSEEGQDFIKELTRKVPGPQKLTRLEQARRMFIYGAKGLNNPRKANPDAERGSELDTILNTPLN